MMMEQFNFIRKLRIWINECISSACATVLVNGSTTTKFKLERGLRQGDYLSLSLFFNLLVVEGLSLMVSKTVNEGLFDVVVLGKDKIKIFHLQYTDDMIFVGKMSAKNA